MKAITQPEFGRRLKALRLERNLSQADLAGADISTGYLSRLESGQRPPTDRAVTFLAQRLGVPEAEFATVKAGTLGELLAKVVSAPEEAAKAKLVAQATESMTADDDPGARWQALWLAAKVQAEQVRREEELKTLTLLAELSDEIGEPDLRARARNQLALCHRSQGDVAQSYVEAGAALSIATEAELTTGEIARALMTLISVETELGRLPDARSHSDELERLAASIPGTLPVEALWTAASVQSRQGDYISATRAMEAALSRLRSQDDLLLWLRLRLAAAQLYLQMNPRQLTAAKSRLAEARPALALIGTTLHQREFLLLQAQLALHEGAIDEALEACKRLAPDKGQLTFRDRIRFDLTQAELLLRQGNQKKAVQAMRTLALEAEEAANIDLAAEIWRTLAVALSETSGPGVQSGTKPQRRRHQPGR